MFGFRLAAIGVALGVLASPVSSAAASLNLCSVPELKLSPSGKFVYVKTYMDLSLIRTDCVLAGNWKTCGVGTVPTNTQIATFFFSGNDTRITTTTEKLGNSLLNTDGPTLDWVETFSTDALMRGQTTPLRSEKNRGDGTRTEGFFDIDPGKDVSDREMAFTQKYRKIIQPVDRITRHNDGVNSRDVYGAIRGNTYVYLYRDNAFDMHLYTPRQADIQFGKNGNSYYEHQSNIAFKFDGATPLARVAGSLVPLTDAGEAATAAEDGDRRSFVNGDSPLGYYGYYGDLGAVLVNVKPSVSTAVSNALRENPKRLITSIAVNNATAGSIISFQSAVADFNRPENARYAYTHILQVGDKRAVISCEDDGLTRTTRAIGGENPIWVESYHRPQATQSVIYIHGGPVEYQDTTNSAQINLFLAHGYNVDVVNYAGSNYNLDLSTRLYKMGQRGLQNDAAQIEKFVRETYPETNDLILYQESHGGVYYRFFSQDFFDHVGKTVLYAPRGSDEVSRYSDIIKAFALKTYGPELFADNFDGTYFANLTSCQIKGPTLMIIGDTDDNVNPDYDYRLCKADPNLVVRRHAGNHDGETKANFAAVFNYISSTDNALPAN